MLDDVLPRALNTAVPPSPPSAALNAVTTVQLELNLEAPAPSRASHTPAPVHPRCAFASLLLRLWSVTTFFQHLGSSGSDSDYRSAPRRLAPFRPNRGSTLSIPTKEKKIEQLGTKQYTKPYAI